MAAMCFSLTGCTVEDLSAPAASPYPQTVISGTLSAAPEVRIYLDGLLSAGGISENGSIYIPVSVLFDYLGLDAEYSAENGTLKITAPGLSFTQSAGDGYFAANHRYFYSPEGYIFRDGEAYLPAEAIKRLFGTVCSVSEDAVNIDTASASIIKGGENYYETRYSFEDVYWLSHAIYNEAMNEPLEGLIAVGNVILNRVKHPLFPSTVYEVIFDTKYSIQFESSLGSAMGDDTDEISLLAAYMCLEGCNTAGKSIFFINPEKADDAWLRQREQFTVSIGRHDFYSEKES